MTEVKDQMEIDRMAAVAKSLGWIFESARRDEDRVTVTISKLKEKAKKVLEE